MLGVSNPFRAGGEALVQPELVRGLVLLEVSNPFRAGGEALGTATIPPATETASFKPLQSGR